MHHSGRAPAAAGFCAIAGLFFSLAASSAVLIHDDFSDTNVDFSVETGNGIGGSSFHHASDATNNVNNNYYWETFRLLGTSPLVVDQEVDALGVHRLVMSSADQSGAGIVFDGINAPFYMQDKTEQVSDRAVNYLDPELDFFNRELTFELDDISIQGAKHGRFHHMIFALTSLSTQPMRWSSFEVRVSANGQVRIRNMQERANPKFFSIIPEQYQLPAVPNNIVIRLNATHYFATFNFAVAGETVNASNTVNGLDFHTLQGGSLTYTGEHGMDEATWRHTIRAANVDNTSPDAIGSAMFIGVQSTNFDLNLSQAERETTVKLGSITVRDNN